MKAKTQQQKVLDYLRTHKRGITSMKAFWLFRITRLSDRIFRLRERGYRIVTIKEDNTFVRGQHGRYVLLGEPDKDII